ncbi:ribonuclease J1 [Xylocopilactobacillus apis]|uniref:Ribonuclease J n=1 Tax=Xylocopilactobacillus apis TaxID=2932183 RepID=A0AAU9DHE8_9LACO|nr:ribonuclease J [Xylocopilactobacillus apis]BDR56157.1 ribonuclease J [Xylocopilactobacillus apis]
MPTKSKKTKNVRVAAIGGLGEIGKNMYCIEYNDKIVVIDCGIKFPEDDLLGIDYVISDYQHLIKNRDKILGLVITHGHEDHIGGIPFLLRQLPGIDIYAGPLALALIQSKLEENGLTKDCQLNEINEDSVLDFGEMSVTFFRTTHSIPDTLGVAVHTPEGIIVQTGDFKFDLTPVDGQPAPNLQRMAKLGSDGVLLLMSDSTNAEIPTFTKSERFVGTSIRNIMGAIEGRIIFASFASNISRIKQASDVAIEQGRKIAVFGRSMEAAIKNGIELGYLDYPKDTLIEPKDVNKVSGDKLMILCTGSQGEPMAALSRIANGTHKQISIVPGDTVIFSSSPIPGNTASVNHVINGLEEAGANVIHGKVNNVHTSGHGGQEEQKLMLRLMKPKFFMPIHGEYRMLKIHTELAQLCDVPKENCFIMENGDVLEVNHEKAEVVDHFPASDAFVDGNGIGDIGNAVIHERQLLSEDGLVAACATVKMKTGQILSGPDILSRGFIYMRESGDLINQAQKQVYHAIKQCFREQQHVNESMLNEAIIDALQDYLYDKTERKPIVIPMIISV